MDQYYSDYQTQWNSLKKKHLKEQQQLEQKLLSQRQELERQMTETNYYSSNWTNSDVPWHPMNEKDSMFPSPTLNQQPSPSLVLESLPNTSETFQDANTSFFPDTFNAESMNFAQIAPSPLIETSPYLEERKWTPPGNLLSVKAANSRHVSSVISHFTGNPEAFTRLAHELDGFLFILTATGHVIFASNSCQAFLGFPENSMIGHSISDYIHPEDEQLVMNHLSSSVHEDTTLSVFCRFRKGQDAVDSQECILMEMVARPVFEKASTVPIFIVNVGREYQSKSTKELDSILALRMENIKLRLKLKGELERQGKDPGGHHLLRIANKSQLQIHQQVEYLNLDSSSGFPFAMESKKESKKRKKQKIPTDELVCRQCGTNSSPEWRRGPTGPKTLCNACGLLYAKKLKMAQQSH